MPSHPGISIAPIIITIALIICVTHIQAQAAVMSNPTVKPKSATRSPRPNPYETPRPYILHPQTQTPLNPLQTRIPARPNPSTLQLMI